jgi:lambda repressor-like predicted transcriptional regulator
MSTNKFRARVEVECARRGWTFAELARRLGITPQALHATLGRYAHRRTTIDKIAAAFGLSVDEIETHVTPAEYGEAMMRRREP